MDTRDMMEMNEQLEKIRGIINTLRESEEEVVSNMVESGALEAQLVRIWDISCGLQRMIVRPRVLDGYRRDAVEQIARIKELLYEQGINPDDRWLTSFGLACDLVQQKIQTYQRMATFSAMTAILTGQAATEAA